jgi:hypothetical protein
MGKIGLNPDGFAARQVADFDFLLAARGFQEDQLRAARRFVAANLSQTENIAIKSDRAFQIIDAEAGVQEFADFFHKHELTTPAWF